MKKISTILIIFICLIFAANFSLAKMGIKKPIVIPPEMQKMESPFELETYLGNPDSRIREAAVIRLGQIGGSDAIPVLLKFFENEPETKGVIDVPYGVKEAVVVALRQIGGEEAKEQILKLLSDTLKFGPIANAYKEKRYTGQASHIIYLSIEALSDFPDDNVIRILEEIAKDQISPRNSFIAQTARRSLVKITLKKQGITRTEDRVNYLVNMLTGSGTGPGTFIRDGLNPRKTEEALKNGAIEDILTDLGLEAGALPYLNKALTRIAEDTERGKAVRNVIKRIENVSKGRSGKAMTIPSIN